MNRPSQIIALAASGCALGLAMPARLAAQVNETDFSELRKMVQEMNARMRQLEQAHDQDQKAHESDQKQIQQLREQLGETQKTASDAQQKAEQVQPVHPVPGEGNASHNFTMVGDAEIQFGKAYGGHSAFTLADFAPIFLFRSRDNVLFEAGFDITLQNGQTSLLQTTQQPNTAHDTGTSTSVSLSFAQLDYLLSDYATLVAGEMLLPLGTYSERGAGWLNKIPDDPMPRGLLPGTGAGAQLRGAVPIGDAGQTLTYSVYGANGPSSVDGSGSAFTLDSGSNRLSNLDVGGNIGVTSSGTFGNLHGSPSGGGRLGVFYPWKPHYDFELGISGQSGTWDDADKQLWTAGVIDAALHLSPFFEAKGEYVQSWWQTTDLGTLTPHGWWMQAAYKLAGLNLEVPYVSNLELVGRFDHANDFFSAKTDRYTLGYVYYFSNTLLFEGDYEFIHSSDPTQSHDAFVFQLSYGF